MSILSDAKEIADLIKKYNDQDLYEKIINLRDEIFELRDENLSLKEQIKYLEKALQTDQELIRKGNVYMYKKDVDHENNKGPWFCMTCWDYENKLVNVERYSNGTFRCRICSSRKK